MSRFQPEKENTEAQLLKEQAGMDEISESSE
jgi:hypothetical protein